MVHEVRPRGLGEALLASCCARRSGCCSSPCFRRASRSVSSAAGWPACRRSPSGRAASPPTAGTVGGCPGEWCRRRVGASRPGSMLYLHGGAYCVGSPATHRALTSRLARVTGLPVFVADYRLAPEHPFPAGLDDARGRLPGAAGRRAGDPGRRFGRRRPGPGHGAGPARRGRTGPGGAGAVLALGRPGHAGYTATGAAGRGHAGLGLDQRLRAPLCGRPRCARRRAGGLPHASAGLAPARRPARPAAGADPGRHRRAAAPPGAGAARRAEGRRRGRALRDHPKRWHVFQLHANALPSADAAIDRVARFVLGRWPPPRRPRPPSTRW
jgi:hypothetical protein